MEISKMMTIGVDVSDRQSHLCFLDHEGNVVRRAKVPTTETGLRKFLGKLDRARVVLEASTHSPWMSRLISELGHETVVASPRQLKLISQSNTKNDTNDAELLARLGRVDVKLLKPVHHRSREAQTDLAAMKVRRTLVTARAALINSIRGIAKSHGLRVRACAASSFVKYARIGLSPELSEELNPLIKTIEDLTNQISSQDERIERLASKYPDTQLFLAVPGVGPVTAVTYLLTLEDKTRFKTSRAVGPYIGLVPRQDQSGKSDKELSITKAGDGELRALLVNCANAILKKSAPDSDLKRWGLKLAERGGPSPKKRAIVAVARKLAVLLHRLWVTGEEFQPLRERPVQAA